MDRRPTGGSPAGVRLRRAGSGGLLVELPDGPAAERLAAALAAAPPPGLLDLVPAARTVLVRCDPALVRPDALERAVRAAVAAADAAGAAGAAGGTAAPGDAVAVVVLDVVYDGEDLDDVARLTGLSAAEVVRRHAAVTQRVAFTGFAPGFGYLTGGDPALRVPRRSTPRTAVPAGAVGLAEEFSGVYPRASPGGWQLVGRTGAVLWDVERDPPALLRPGVRVRFRPVRELVRLSAPHRAAPAVSDPRTTVAGVGLEVLATGPRAQLVDDGRDGRADLGVGPSGAADRASAHTANACAGAPRSAVCVEVTGGGLVLVSRGPTTVAVAGAPVPLLRDGAPVPGPVVALDDGGTLALGAPSRGLRTYLALRGGLVAPRFLGSACTDALSGLGPAPLAVGDVLVAAGERADAVVDEVSPTALPEAGPRGAPAVLRVVAGPRDDAVAPGLCDGEWEVGVRSDRVGTRLARPAGAPHGPLRHTGAVQLPSEGVVRGGLQVPPDGLPVLFGPDRPVTGGYPVVAVVADADLDATGQLPPGTRLRFTPA